ncbi:ABC transporter substrate-binding protein [Microvirga sp. VF16]|uniref:ABC transporter substrate-binding protein n=1 Tax=Microvirga sp. VF16 TaxID=2807101 RepID=UPI00193E3AC5|nr:ABC transporter substrate-binding protein [Microvirga sp. VF16]QRM34059.1 ABC transporter substrate-binding protein [Microvirga sp. VF16]
MKLGYFCAAALLPFVLSAMSARAQISNDAVRIGVLTDLSGPYSASTGKGSVTAARMAAEDAGGKVLGKPVEILAGDHQNKPDVGSTLARRWFDQDGVDAVADMPTSSIALAVQKLAMDKGKVTLIAAGATSDLTGPACSPTGVHWVYDTYALSQVVAKALVAQGGDSWYFVTADYALGQALERDTGELVTHAGGKVVGSVRHPLGTTDFTSFLLQAQSSGAKVIAFANAGADTANAIKQAQEFGLTKGGQKLVGLLTNIVDMKGVGLADAQGMLLTEAFYWDRTPESRQFAQRFYEREKAMPTPTQAGIYSAVRHYLKAIERAGTDEGKAVVPAMRAEPISDFFAEKGTLREDGRMVHDMYLFQVKNPQESKGDWDLYKLVSTLPGDEVFRPLKDGNCPFIK